MANTGADSIYLQDDLLPGNAAGQPTCWADMEETQEQRDSEARSVALQTQALQHAHCDDAAKACWYLCRSLGMARQMEVSHEPTLELLFQLLGALSDLPAEISSAPLPEQIGSDKLGISVLCQQLAAARELSHGAWVDADLAAPTHAQVH
ncbi:hypothetical protein ACVBEH_02095 [Roseateles sp. GG27B]